MRSDPPASWPHTDLRPPGSPVVIRAFIDDRRGLVGRVNDCLDLLGWPVLTTALSLVGARRLIQPDRPHREADPIG